MCKVSQKYVSFTPCLLGAPTQPTALISLLALFLACITYLCSIIDLFGHTILRQNGADNGLYCRDGYGIVVVFEQIECCKKTT